MTDDLLFDVLDRARRHGHLGPGPIEDHVARSRRFGQAVRTPVGTAVDLGAGGGVPGLVLAFDGVGDRWLLVDRRTTRIDDLRQAVGRLALGDRVEVVVRDVVELGRDVRWRCQADLVTARSFGHPAEVAELAAPLLRVGGQLLVSEPPAQTPDRWNSEGLALLGLRPDGEIPDGVASFTQVAPCPERFPRRRRRPTLW
jgi:16S rRNA (guanine527-N7)-methyltransferase